MLPALVVCISALVLVILCLLWLIRLLLQRVEVLTNGFARASVATMSQAREVVHGIAGDQAGGLEKVLEAMSQGAARQSADMLEMIKVAWMPAAGLVGNHVGGGDAGGGVKHPFAGLETTYGDETKQDDRDPTDAWLSELPTGRHESAAVISPTLDDPDNPFGIEGLVTPRFG